MKENLSPPNKPSSDPPPEVSAVLQLDPDIYRGYLDEYDMSHEQQNELLETLWHIMRSFVELSFDLDNVELFSNEKDQDSGNQAINLLSIDDSSDTFNKAAKRQDIKEDLSND